MSARFIEPDERRTYSRIERIHKLFLQVIDERPAAERRLLRCTCENQSARGVGVTLVEPLERGTTVELWINVEDHEIRFLLGGRVAWCRPAVHRCLHEMGIELTHGADDEFARWQSLWHETR